MELSAIEPMIPSEARFAGTRLPELALELERKAAALGGLVSPVTAQVLEAHMRVINSYYSNLIEGHHTHPRDIRKAMAGDYSADPAKRDLQLESLAHMAVQEALSEQQIATDEPLAAQCFSEIHRYFYEALPDSLRIVRGEDGSECTVIPGQLRQPGESVIVGRHVAPPAELLARFMDRYAQAYRIDHLHGHVRVIAAMAAHHRFAWIHPFLDGNGRVARLHTDVFLRAMGVGGVGIWCLSRGLARDNEGYKAALARADQPRQGDGDGRGALSEQGLIAFCEFMLLTAIDQVDYMADRLDLQGMCQRIQAYVDDRNKGLIPGIDKLKPEAVRLLEKAFMLGEFPRGDMERISGLGLSVTRKLVQQLKEDGLLTETSSRSPLRWAIPEHGERYYLPELSPV